MIRLRGVTMIVVTPRAIANVLGPGPPDMRLNRRGGYFRSTGSCGVAPSYSLLSKSTASPEDLKVVMSLKEGRATIGVQRPSSDPHIKPVDASDISGLTQEVLAVVERARAKWEDAPRFPAYAWPVTPTGRQSHRNRGASQASTQAEAESQQQTLRLF